MAAAAGEANLLGKKNFAGDTPLMETFSGLDGRYRRVHEISGRHFAPECALIEEAVPASFSIYLEMARFAKLDERQQYLLAFFYRNCVYLSAAYRLIRSGMSDPAGNSMRTIFETIIWQYAYLSDDGIYANFREMAAMDEEKLSLVKAGGWSNTKERALENLRRKYSFQKMMKKLYSKERYERLFYSQYWALCQKSHSSVFGINHNTPNMSGGSTFDGKEDASEVRGSMMAVLYLCAENLICLLNCFPAILPKKAKDSALGLANRINRAIPASPGLAPDTVPLEFTVRFREA